MELDSEDRKILHALDFNSRQSISRIAKRTKLSRDIVTYRMKKLEQNGIISKYHTIIDISKFGYAAYKNFIRLTNISEEKEKEFLEWVVRNPKAVYSARYDGMFDIVVSLWARNIKELSQSIREMENLFGEYMDERVMAPIVKGEYKVRDYLLGKERYTKRAVFFGSVPDYVELDDADYGILLELGKDARAKVVDIAEKLSVSADTVFRKIKNMEKLGVIQNYNIVPNEEKYPFQHYKILISVKRANDESEKKLVRFCRESIYVWYFCTTFGHWDFEIDMEVPTREHFREFLREMKLELSDVIKNYSVLSAYKTNKYNFFPSKPFG